MTQIYKGSTGGGGGTGVLSLTGNDGSAVTPVANNINLLGIGGNYIFNAGSPNMEVNNLYWITQYTVSNSTVPGENAAYSTIGAAIVAANAAGGGTVAIRQGTYVENIVLLPNVNLVGFAGINEFPDTVINGTVTANFAGEVTLTNLGITELSGSPLQLGGSSFCILFMNNVVINSTLSPCITMNNASGVIFNQAGVVLQNGAFPHFTITGGQMLGESMTFGDNVGNSTISTVAVSGGVQFINCNLTIGVEFLDGTGGQFFYCALKAKNSPCFIANDNSDIQIEYCSLSANNTALGAINIPSATAGVGVVMCQAGAGSSPYPVMGIGTFNYDHLSLGNGDLIDPGLNISLRTVLPVSTAALSNSSAVVGHCSFNSADFTVDSTGFVSSSGSSSLTFDGDSGTATPSGGAITIYADQAVANCGATVAFVNTGSTSTLNVSDSSLNTIVGNLSGNHPYAGSATTAFGYGNLITSSVTNAFVTCLGSQSMVSATNCQNIISIGFENLVNVTSGSSIICIGNESGGNYSSAESSNIIINNSGVTGESNVIRIGTQGSSSGQQDSCYIAGITGASPVGANVPEVTLCDNTGNLSVISSNSTGYVLTSNGILTNPTFQPAPGSSAIPNYTTVDFAMSPYTVLAADYYISCDSSGGPISLVFPTVPTAKRAWIIKDRTGTAATNNITITAGGTTIDSASSKVILSTRGSVQMISNTIPTYEVF